MKIFRIVLTVGALAITLTGASGDETTHAEREDTRTCDEYLEVIGDQPDNFKEEFWEHVCAEDTDAEES